MYKVLQDFTINTSSEGFVRARSSDTLYKKSHHVVGAYARLHFAMKAKKPVAKKAAKKSK